MANAVDYIDWRGDIDLDISPFNEIDALLLTQVAMIDLGGIVPGPESGEYIDFRDAASIFFRDKKRSRTPLGLIIPKETVTLFRKMGKSERYSKMKLGHYVHDTDHTVEQQFSALTVMLGNGSTFIAFRGTDDSIVGWKEDLNLAFMPSIPSQIEAVTYFDRVGEQIDGKVIVGGHSKGGNLAVFAAVVCEDSLRKRITDVYCFDGPGFGREFTAHASYREIEDRLRIIVPQSSVVGMLFENGRRYSVVKSTENGIFQHNALTWECKRDKLVRMPELCEQSRKVSAQINLLIADLDMDARRRFAEAIYDALTSTKASTLTELYEDRFAILRSLSKADKDTRRLVLKLFSILMSDGNGQLFGTVVGSIFGGKKDDKKKPTAGTKSGAKNGNAPKNAKKANALFNLSGGARAKSSSKSGASRGKNKIL